MSVTVELGELAERIASYGFAYLVTVGDGGSAHVLAVTPVVSDAGIALGGVGRHTLGNVEANPRATLVWPPVETGGYSLIVDGSVTADPDAATVTVAPTKAILHRPAPGADGQRVGNDCQTISLP
jgi:hypothetical protein